MLGWLLKSPEERKRIKKQKKMQLRYRGEIPYTITITKRSTGERFDEEFKFTALLYQNDLDDRRYDLIGDNRWRGELHKLDRWHDLEAWKNGGLVPEWCTHILIEKLSQ
mgnify:CR=1 FL=1